MTEEKKKNGGISRREFLKDAGLIVGGTAIGSTVLLAACGGETVTETVTKTVTTTAGEVTTTATQNKFVCPVCGQEFNSLAELQAHFESAHAGESTPALNVINITLNGHVYYNVVVKPNMTLRDLLRDEFGCTSVKDMCNGYGACGTCTVILDGRPVLSCMTLAITCDGSVIETTEGVTAANHPLIEAYINNNCMQCGYCTPGFVVTAKALLDKNPNPTEEEVREALAGNLCICATYPHHIPAVLEAAGNL